MKRITTFLAALMNGQLDTPRKFFDALSQQRADDAADPTAFQRFEGTYRDDAHYNIPARLEAEPAFFTAEHFLKRHNSADWQHVDWRMKVFAARFIEACRKRGIPMYVHGAFRSKEQQLALYKKRVSNSTWPRAPHCQGKAVDIVHGRFHWEMTKAEWALMGKIGKDVARKLGFSIEWGGDWRSPWDPAHWQMEDWDRHISQPDVGFAVRKTPRGLLAETKGV